VGCEKEQIRPSWPTKNRKKKKMNNSKNDKNVSSKD
jgi:hypothetical protein